MKLPNFFIIGAPKCGTTSLSHWLSEHPQIYFSPVKEPFYYSTDILQKFRKWDEYINLFKDAEEAHLAVGEGSTIYLFSQVAVNKIESIFDQPRYIIMLRDPVEMAYSLHEQQCYCFNENISNFNAAWHLSQQRRAGRKVPPGCKSPQLLDYQNFCLLGEQVERLLSIVPRNRIHVILLDDIRDNVRSEYQRTLAFLGVNDDGRDNFPVYNRAKKWRNKWQGRLVRLITKNISWLKYKKRVIPKRSFGFINLLKRNTLMIQKRPLMEEQLRKELKKFYIDDVKKLGEILDRDLLSLWKF